MNLLWHNFIEWLTRPAEDREYLIRCEKCGLVQVKARGWNFQLCQDEQCKSYGRRTYLYDYRGLDLADVRREMRE